MRSRGGWRSLGEWTLALGMAAYAMTSLPSIGMFVLPVAIAAAVLAARRNRAWPEAVFGGLLGVATVCLLVAYLNRDSTPCPSTGMVSLGPGERGRCGGWNPMPWLSVGLSLVAVGLGGYVAVRRAQPEVTT